MSRTGSGASGAGRAVVVLGYARSGTSTVARSLDALGVDLGDRLRAGKKRKNPRGFFEDEGVLEVNRRLRRALLPPHGISLVTKEMLLGKPQISVLEDEAVATLSKAFADRALWGFKNNGVSRFFPFWERVFDRLDAEVCYVLAVRHPLRAVSSRQRHRLSKPYRMPRPLEIDFFEWLVSVVPFVSRMHGKPFVVVDYDRIMDDPLRELERISAILDLPSPHDRPEAVSSFSGTFLSRDLTHFSAPGAADTAEDDRMLPPTVREAWVWLRELARDEVDPDDPLLWKAWAGLDARVLDLAPLLSHVDAIDSARHKAVFNPLSPLQWLWQSLRRWWDTR